MLDDVVGNTETIERLKIIAREGNMPHIIISGTPGIGKTTSILCLARQMLGESYKEAVLELNASDERGMLDFIFMSMKGNIRLNQFIMHQVSMLYEIASRHLRRRRSLCPPVDIRLSYLMKLIGMPTPRGITFTIGNPQANCNRRLNSMTSGAQQALRRTMEIYSSTTRFAFACNQSNKIIEPLQSRCAILRYSRLTDAQLVKRILQICEAENVQYSEDGIAALVFSAEGDMRQAVNNLQSTWAGFNFVSGDNVFRVVDSPHPVKVQAMIKACYDGNIDAALDLLNELW